MLWHQQTVAQIKWPTFCRRQLQRHQMRWIVLVLRFSTFFLCFKRVGTSCHGPQWRHPMETFSASLAFCAVTSEFLTQRPVTQSFYVFFDLRLNEQLSKHRWIGTLLCSLWRHCNGNASHSADGILKCIILTENQCVLTELSLNFIPNDPIGNESVLVQVMAWRRISDDNLVHWRYILCHNGLTPQTGEL